MSINSTMDEPTVKAMRNPAERSLSEISVTFNKNLAYPATNSSPQMSKWRVLRNLFIISFAYLLYFSGFWSLTNLQSTMNADHGMGPYSQAVIYLCSMVSCFIPDYMIGRLGNKKTYIIALVFSCPYIASNFHLRWDVIMATSVIYGLASGPLNAALNIYIDELSTRYNAYSDESRENIQATFFGFYMFFSECTQILGNSVSFYILNKGKHPPVILNVSIHDECGINFRPNVSNTNLEPPTDHDRFMLSGTFLSMGVLAVFVSLLLDPLKNDLKDVKGCNSVLKKIVEAAKLLKNPHLLLLIPISIYCGMEGVLYSNEVTEAFIACSWGVHHVGFVSICFGVCGALMSILVGPLVKCISQMSVIILAAIINVVTCGLLFVWEPSPETPVAYFAFAGVWGMTDAIWWSQMAALYGLMFPNDREAAFSNFFFWSFLGYFISYSYANYFTVAVKINIMLVFLIVGITLYIAGQIKIKCCSERSVYTEIGENE